MADRFELKLGTTFTNPRNTSFHTLKYDFKPASVDESKMASVDITQNNQVTVTVPHLDNSGTPHTVFKGNQKNYSKECVLIVNKSTGEIIIEKLTNNIQVKKTRSENGYNKPLPVTSVKLQENSTQRQSSKTKVTSGARKATISNFLPKHSPIQSSPTYPVAAQWSASHNQSNLASLPMIGFDESEPVAEDVHSAQISNDAIYIPNQNLVDNHMDVGVLSSSSSSSSSDSSDSDSETDTSQSKPSNGNYMPSSLLNEDLQLSESD